MAESKAQTKVVKVKPYPIPCQLKKENPHTAISCEVLRVEQIGFILKSSSRYYKPGDEYVCEFELPVVHHKIIEKIKIIKTLQTVGANADERDVTVEVHFADPFNKSEEQIRQFIAKIGQKPLGPKRK